MAFASAAAGFQGLHPFHRSGIPALAFLPPDLPEPKFLPILTLLQPELFPVSRRSAVCTASRLWPPEALASWRLSPGIAFPFRVTLVGTTGELQSPAWVTCSVPREHSVPFDSTHP